MKASDFDKKFDDGVEDIIDDLDLSTLRRPNRDVEVAPVRGEPPNKRVNLTRSTAFVVTWSRSPRRLRAVRWADEG